MKELKDNILENVSGGRRLAALSAADQAMPHVLACAEAIRSSNASPSVQNLPLKILETVEANLSGTGTDIDKAVSLLGSLKTELTKIMMFDRDKGVLAESERSQALQALKS